MDRPQPLRDRWLALLLLVFTVAAYLPALSAGFIWDDDRYVTNNILLRAPDGLWRIWFSTDSPSQYVPMVYSTFWLEYAAWGLSAAGYHLVNVLLHAANAMLLWRLLRRLSAPGAWLAAAIFVLHPVQVESVAWISERKNVLSLFFYLLAALSWIEFVEERVKQPRRFYALSLVFYALALLSKATACTLPAALLLLLWLKGKPINRLRLGQILPFIALGIGMGFVAMAWERYHQGTQGETFAVGLLERLLIASRAVWFYAGKLVWPTHLSFIYPRWMINTSDPLAYAWLVAGAGMCAAIYVTRRRIERGVEVAALFYVATLSPLLGFIMLYTFRYTFVADHYQYVASIGPLSLMAAGITLAAHHFKKRMPWLQFAVCAALLLVLGVLTWHQAGIYRDHGTLWRDTLNKNPACWMAENNLANFLGQQGRTNEALVHYQKALALKPDFAEAHYNLGVTLVRRGQLDAGINHLETAIKIDPDYEKAHNNLGIALIGAGRLDEAIRHFEKAFKLRPKLTTARINLAIALSKKGRFDEAIRHVQQVLSLNPNDAEAQRLLMVLFDGKASAALQPTNSAAP